MYLLQSQELARLKIADDLARAARERVAREATAGQPRWIDFSALRERLRVRPSSAGAVSAGKAGRAPGQATLSLRNVRRRMVGALALTALATMVAVTPVMAAIGWSAWATHTSNFDQGYGRAQWWANDCRYDGGFISPGTRGSMQEVGTTKVQGMKMTYIYQTKNSYGSWATSRTGPTYRWTTTPGSSVTQTGTGAFYRFAAFVAPDGGRLAIRFTWDESPLLTRDPVRVQAVAYC